MKVSDPFNQTQYGETPMLWSHSGGRSVYSTHAVENPHSMAPKAARANAQSEPSTLRAQLSNPSSILGRHVVQRVKLCPHTPITHHYVGGWVYTPPSWVSWTSNSVNAAAAPQRT